MSKLDHSVVLLLDIAELPQFERLPLPYRSQNNVTGELRRIELPD